MFRFDKRLLVNFDWILLGAVIVIAVIGVTNLYSACYTSRAYGTPVYLKQLYYFLAGLALFLFVVSIDYRLLINFAYPAYLTIIVLLVLALTLGKTVGGSQRWINLGFFSLQPSEPAKLVLVITLASYYFRKDTEKGFSLKELVVPLVLTLVPFLLIVKQPDLGTGLMLLFVFVSITLFVKLKWSALASLSGAALGAAVIGWKYVLRPYQRQRIETFLNPESDPLNTGYHIMQSKIAMGSGLKFGKGFLKGTQGQLAFLPERHTDFIFSVWAEEWGFVGSLFLLACYFFIVLWGLNIAAQSRDKFGVLLAYGISALLFWQAFINLAMVMGLLPVVGMPLPLVSYGGSSLLTTMLGLGLLMNIRMRRYLTAKGGG